MPVPVITIEQMRRWEAATWEYGTTEADVIARVGKIVAARVEKLTQPGDVVLLVAGKGHNGDDVRAAAPHLKDREASLLNISDPKKALKKLALALDPPPALVVDGLFGIGLNRPLDAQWVQLIAQINHHRLAVLSVDTPSGLDAGTGEVQGAAVRASVTLTLGAPKHGLLVSSASPFVGRLEAVQEIGLIPCRETCELQWGLETDFSGFPPPRPPGGHKGVFGHLAIIAGSPGFHGAAVLAARGGLRARPGLVTLLTQEDVYVPVASQLQAAMVHPLRPGEDNTIDFATGLVLGPGLAAPGSTGDFQESVVAALWREAPLVVLADASALDWIPPGSTPNGETRVITPHPGEASRMLDTDVAAVQADRPAALRQLSRNHGGCWVVLKGRHTLVGRAEGEIFVNPSGNPAMAQGGSGDLLAGYLGGLLAQPELREDISRTLRFGVWQHAAAADALDRESSNWTLDELECRLGSIQPCGIPTGET